MPNNGEEVALFGIGILIAYFVVLVSYKYARWSKYRKITYNRFLRDKVFNHLFVKKQAD